MAIIQYEIVWPDELDDFDWSMVESKGWLSGVKIKVGADTIEPLFYDKARLLQDVEAELELSGYFAEPAIIVLERVTQQAIEQVIERMASAGTLNSSGRNS